MTDIVSIDMSPGKAPIGIEKYIDLVKLSLKKLGSYKIYLEIGTKKFLCEVYDGSTFFLGSGNVFMTLHPNGKGDIKTRGIDFETIELNGKKNKLDTIFYLRTFFYRMLKVTTLYITDVAQFLCKDKDIEYEYTALMYRIFATNKPLDELCIYQRYFKKIMRDSYPNDNKLEELLIKFRQSPCPFDKSITIRNYFREFDKNCPTMAPQLNELYNILDKDKDFKDFYSFLSSFSALTKDSIYWPTEPAFKHKRKSKKSKKSKTKKSKTPKRK